MLARIQMGACRMAPSCVRSQTRRGEGRCPGAGGQGVGHGWLLFRRYRLSVCDAGKFQKWMVVMVVQPSECT